jgi:hypothetical protein
LKDFLQKYQFGLPAYNLNPPGFHRKGCSVQAFPGQPQMLAIVTIDSSNHGSTV